MSAEAEIQELTESWCEQISGMSVLVPIGAALNVLTTVGMHSPPEVRKSMVQFLHVVANKLEGMPQ
jgi:hypothetical protein